MDIVAPHAGAWIEMQYMKLSERSRFVAPHAGAWIEIIISGDRSAKDRSRPTRARGLKFVKSSSFCKFLLSRPTRARGLKFNYLYPLHHGWRVAPHAGAWIEIRCTSYISLETECRAPRGRVD